MLRGNVEIHRVGYNSKEWFCAQFHRRPGNLLLAQCFGNRIAMHFFDDKVRLKEGGRVDAKRNTCFVVAGGVVSAHCL